jgi:hypothetical protein
MWRTPEDLITIGFSRARVVMMNEFHNGLLRCPWTREVGARVLPTAHNAGVHRLAMEALIPHDVAAEANRTRQAPAPEGGYLAQPEMRLLIQMALDLGWTLHAYEADIGARVRERLGRDVDFNAPIDEETKRKLESIQAYTTSMEVTNWREGVQADNLIGIYNALPEGEKLLVWCGNSHHNKQVSEMPTMLPDGTMSAEVQRWVPMGYQFREKSGVEPFTIHQMPMIHPNGEDLTAQWLGEFAPGVDALGGIAGFLRGEAPHERFSVFMQGSAADAVIFSTKNWLE